MLYYCMKSTSIVYYCIAIGFVHETPYAYTLTCINFVIVMAAWHAIMYVYKWHILMYISRGSSIEILWGVSNASVTNCWPKKKRSTGLWLTYTNQHSSLYEYSNTCTRCNDLFRILHLSPTHNNDFAAVAEFWLLRNPPKIAPDIIDLLLVALCCGRVWSPTTSC